MGISCIHHQPSSDPRVSEAQHYWKELGNVLGTWDFEDWGAKGSLRARGTPHSFMESGLGCRAHVGNLSLVPNLLLHWCDLNYFIEYTASYLQAVRCSHFRQRSAHT